MPIWELFWQTFLPFFVAFDPIGLLPIYLSLTAGLDPSQIRKTSAVAVVVALGICIFFGLFGHFLLWSLGITFADFQIAGGLLLIVFSITDSQSHEQRRPDSYIHLAVVPLAMPLLVGPAVLTTLLLAINVAGTLMTFLALAVNLGIVYVFFYYSKWVFRAIGQTGARGVGKFFSIVLCAIGVMFIRKGVFTILGMQ